MYQAEEVLEESSISMPNLVMDEVIRVINDSSDQKSEISAYDQASIDYMVILEAGKLVPTVRAAAGSTRPGESVVQLQMKSYETTVVPFARWQKDDEPELMKGIQPLD